MRVAPDAGFTLIELMITITVMSILLGIGVPSFRNFVASQQVRAASSDLSTMLIYARSEAIKRNNSVIAAPVSTNWKNGWTVTVGGTTTVVSRREGFPVGIAIAGPTSVTYNNNGRVTAATSPSFNISSSGTTRTSTVSVDLSGMPKTVGQN